MATVDPNLKSKERVRDFLSGLIAGVISVTVCNPLDIARTRLNVMVHSLISKSSPNHDNTKYNGFMHSLKVIWKEEGIRGFYTGILCLN